MGAIRDLFGKRKNFLLIFSGVMGVVLVWRGLWGLMDAYLFPDHPEMSYAVSIAIGVIILLIDDYELEELNYQNTHKKKKR